MSKQDQAVQIYREEMEKIVGGISIRQRVIGRIETELGMSTAGASTYCANAKKIVESGGISTQTKAKEPKVKAVSTLPKDAHIPKKLPDDINVLYCAVTADKEGTATKVSAWRDRECAELEAKQSKLHFVVGLQVVGEKVGVVEKGSKPAK